MAKTRKSPKSFTSHDQKLVGRERTIHANARSQNKRAQRKRDIASSVSWR
jgi:hypothetical protein